MTTRRSIRTAGFVLLAAALTVTGASCGGDDAADETTTAAEESTTIAAEETASTVEEATTTPESTTTAATTTTAASTTTVGETTTTVDGEIEIGDFEGAWEAVSYTITSNDDPSVTLDVIELGVVLTAETDRQGRASGRLEVPESLGGPLELGFAITFELIDQETMNVTFEPEIPPLLTDFTGELDFDGQTMSIGDENAVFDFEDGNGEVPVTAVATLERA